MGKERKNKSHKTRVGISFLNSNLELLDEFASTHYGGDRSKAINFLIRRTLKAKDVEYARQVKAENNATPEGYRPLTAF